MPDSLSPLLTAVNRADCIDFLESKMKAQVNNRFGRKSEMTKLSKDYIRVQLSPQSDWQMKVLATSDSTQVICTVSTAYGPVYDSSIQFFDTDWKRLTVSDYVTPPVLNDFFIATDLSNVEAFDRLRKSVDMLLMKAELSVEETDITFTLSTPEYMEKETAEKIKPFLCRPLKYKWLANGYSLDRSITLPSNTDQ